jgi:RNA-directed DNA polymerase
MVTALVNGVEGGKWYSLNKRWPNAYFANAGLFALYPAWRAESHP